MKLTSNRLHTHELNPDPAVVADMIDADLKGYKEAGERCCVYYQLHPQTKIYTGHQISLKIVSKV